MAASGGAENGLVSTIGLGVLLKSSGRGAVTVDQGGVQIYLLIYR